MLSVHLTSLQFPDALKVVARALDVNGVRHVQLAGSKQVRPADWCLLVADFEARTFASGHGHSATVLPLHACSIATGTCSGAWCTYGNQQECTVLTKFTAAWAESGN